MKICLLTLTYNESKLIPHFLNYYSKFCDKIVVFDNESDDGTVDIINQYPNTEVHINKTNNKINDTRYLEIKNHAWKAYRFDYDWQIVVDLDEFIYMDGTPESILNVLKDYKTHDINIINTMGYNIISDTFPEDYSKPIFDHCDLGFEAKTYGKTVIFNPSEISDINYRIGAHICEPNGKIKLGWSRLKLLHYRYFGYEHWLNKNKLYVSRVDPNIHGAEEYIKFDQEINTEDKFKDKFRYNERYKVI